MGHLNSLYKQIILKNLRMHSLSYMNSFSYSRFIPYSFLQSHLLQIGINFLCFVFKSQTILGLNISYLQDYVIKIVFHESQANANCGL